MAQPTLSERVVAEIRAELARQRMTVGSVTDRVYGVSPNTMRRKLSGLYPLDLDELAQVAKLLGVAPEELVARAAQHEREAV